MASAPQAPGLPVLYNDLVPLSASEHGTWRMRQMDDLSLLANVHALPLTTEEFIIAQRSMPIIFSSGGDPVPLALMGLNDGMNVFIEDGKFTGSYLPAYMRRYPFMLARLRPEAEEMTLCFDPTSGLLGEFDEGVPLFENGEPTEPVKQALTFCENFEQAAMRTAQFMKDILATGMVEEGEVKITNDELPQPYTYRGFQMISEEKLREQRGDQLRKMNQSGMLLLIHTHLFSLNLMSEVFNKQVAQGKMPELPSATPDPLAWRDQYDVG